MSGTDDDGRPTLTNAITSARGRTDVRLAVECVHQTLQDAIDLRRPVCESSGRCCRFEEFGHRLYITTMELAVFADALLAHHAAMPDLPAKAALAWNGPGCPFQLEKLCSVHPLRPFGCRIFFCDETAQRWQEEQYERLHSHLKREHDRLGVPYFYIEWRAGLAAICVPSFRQPGSSDPTRLPR